jgi:VanZ family protein
MRIYSFQKIYKIIFWSGYLMVFVTSFIPLKNDLHKQTLNLFSFKFHLDQVLHSIVYLLICIYFFIGDYFGSNLFRKNSVRNFLFVILILAVMTETVQLFVPSRTFNFFDMLANVIGVGIGFGIMNIVKLIDIKHKIQI